MSNSVKIEKIKIDLKNGNNLVDINFNIDTSTAIIGESGSGKSLTLKALLDLLPKELDKVVNISSNFNLKKDQVGIIPQNPFTSLSPMTKIKDQFFCKKEKKKEILNKVGLNSWVLNRFPTQLSGGQLQRVIIAITLSKDLKLLLLDEPTTALDEINKNNITKLIKNLVNELNILILYVTHDIESIIDVCENIIIIKKGKIIEEGKTKDILNNPKNDYTKILIESNFKNRKFRE
ncbi:ABC transporter ATP-binding protein [Malaciobacter molluscorum LMG 25693]|uniref:ABC transporter ATP-binding protein n=1 Tax=Malaciobacter molluscorum LMG 25693 TaxID=870501 RepID=A0A2G1DEZ0_9BACT|nr:ATP-binding cassette domain-containing protein [Malaciobacter molluscorum]AXX93270.1 ABC transporter, ATP-binding protein [Malaciobacter molluscorum LMG 25693]PHO17055.1 ABC transporter ATP-binding protein [Malaciobacter molluscorum LMG 25693]